MNAYIRGIVIAAVLLVPALAFASSGGIDSTNRYAWSDSVGWIDFGTSAGDVQASDSALTGYAYGENIGWISLNCSNTSSCADNDYAIGNDGSGNLSGYAWSSTVGWINFAPSDGGVHINTSTGVFSGTAYGENIGWINFGTDEPVTTTWRPSSSGSSGGSGGSSGGSNGPIFEGPSSALPGYVAPREQIIFPDGTTLYLGSTSSPETMVPPTSAPEASSGVKTVNPAFGRDLHTGMSGSDVLALQKYLNAQGFLLASRGTGSPGQESDYFGVLTKAALIRFQNAHAMQILAPFGLTQGTGYFGASTRSFIGE